MPGGDKTGPAGEGPQTGRGAGFCAGNDRPGCAGATPGGGFWRSGRGRGGGRGFGGGRGRGRGRGRGWGFWRQGGGQGQGPGQGNNS